MSNGGTQPWIERLWRIFKPNSPVVDAGGRFRVSELFGLHDNKNISSSNPNQWHEEIYGAIIEYSGLTGTFQVAEEIRGTQPAHKIPIGTVISDTGSALTIYCSHNNFTVGDTITGQTSGATATIVSAGTGSDIQHNYDHAAVTLRVGTGANDYAIRQSVLPAVYVAGKGQNPDMTFKVPAQKSNVVCRIGAFNQYDGPFYEVTENDVAFVIRSSTSGTASDANRIPQSKWNIDRLDGSKDKRFNPSGKTLHVDRSHFVAFPYLWQGVGPCKGGFIIDNELIYCHEFVTANKSDVVYMRNPSLPARYEIRNTGVTASPTEMEEYCSTISSEGGYNLPGLEFVIDDSYVARTITGTAFVPIMAVRLKAEFPVGKPNNRLVRFLSTVVEASVNDAYVRLVHVHEPVDITPDPGITWISVSPDSAMEYSLNITGYVGRPSHNVLSVYATTAAANKSASSFADVSFINLHSFIAQNYDSTNSQMFVLEAKPKTGSPQISRSMTVIEFE